jgi:serine phosphatase RsbU (regulator of sigma subunit)
VADIAEDAAQLCIANCGHPAPLLIHDTKVQTLNSAEPVLPLGLGALDGEPCRVDAFDFAPGDTLLLYTDGVIEARNAEGQFYPLSDRIGAWTSYSPDKLLEAIRVDLMSHAGGRLADDVVMVAVRHAV